MARKNNPDQPRPWAALGISESTYYRRKRAGKLDNNSQSAGAVFKRSTRCDGHGLISPERKCGAEADRSTVKPAVKPAKTAKSVQKTAESVQKAAESLQKTVKPKTVTVKAAKTVKLPKSLTSILDGALSEKASKTVKPEETVKSDSDSAISKAPEKRVVGRPIQPGQVLNPTGRPKGSRNKVTERYISAMCADFEQHGEVVIQEVRSSKPEVYLRCIADLVPKQVEVGEAGAFESMDDAQLDAFIGRAAQELRQYHAGAVH